MRRSSTRTRLADVKFHENSEEQKRLTIELEEIERERFVEISSLNLSILNISSRFSRETPNTHGGILKIQPMYLYGLLVLLSRVELTVNLPKLEPYIPSAPHPPSSSSSSPPLSPGTPLIHVEGESILPGELPW